MIQTSGTRYNYYSQIPVTPSRVGQFLIFIHVGCDIKTQFLSKAHICIADEKLIK
jgi:hypothetical protein